MSEAPGPGQSLLAPFKNAEAVWLAVLGFAGGLPIVLVFGTLSVWLRQAGVDRTTIGFVSWVALAYAFKFVWSPFVDSIGFGAFTRSFGKRRSWLLIAQAGVVVGLLGMAASDPQIALVTLVGFAVLTAFASATQDIVIDAYRIECAPADRQAALAATYLTGYRIGMIVSGAGALLIAGTINPNKDLYLYSSWSTTYVIMALVMALPVIGTLFMPEPTYSAQREAGTRVRSLASWFHDAVYSPFADFFKRYGWTALVVLLVIGSYRISDIVLGVIANVFYVDMGFSNYQIGIVTKVFGPGVTLLGSFIGGAFAPRIGLGRMLILGAVLVSLTNLLFAWLASSEPTTMNLALVICADNLSAGLAIAAFIAYLSGLTNLQFSATQYALFSSLMVLPPKILGGFSGWLVDQLDYSQFFVACSLLGIPVVLLLLLLRRVTSVDEITPGPLNENKSQGFKVPTDTSSD